MKKLLKMSPTQEEEKNDISNLSAGKVHSLDAYVTKIEPSQKNKIKKELTIKSLKNINSNPEAAWPYYIEQVIRNINQEDDHPSKEHVNQSITTLNYL